MKRCLEGIVLVAGCLWGYPAAASEGLAVVEPLFPLRRVEQGVRRGMQWGLSPFFNYARRLGRLLPSRHHLPDHLAHREHWDYPGPLQWIPRGWTTYDWGEPSLLLGNQTHAMNGAPKPIGERGSFQVSNFPELPVPFCWLPLYVAATFPNGVHFRLGARWDDVDDYVNLPSIALKKQVK
jgi:hypothetical protein